MPEVSEVLGDGPLGDKCLLPVGSDTGNLLPVVSGDPGILTGDFKGKHVFSLVTGTEDCLIITLSLITAVSLVTLLAFPIFFLSLSIGF